MASLCFERRCNGKAARGPAVRGYAAEKHGIAMEVQREEERRRGEALYGSERHWHGLALFGLASQWTSCAMIRLAMAKNGLGARQAPRQEEGNPMDYEIAPELVGELAKICAEENARQRNWIYKFVFSIRWVYVSRRPWSGSVLDYEDIIRKDTPATVEGITAAIETMRRLIEEDR